MQWTVWYRHKHVFGNFICTLCVSVRMMLKVHSHLKDTNRLLRENLRHVYKTKPLPSHCESKKMNSEALAEFLVSTVSLCTRYPTHRLWSTCRYVREKPVTSQHAYQRAKSASMKFMSGWHAAITLLHMCSHVSCAMIRLVGSLCIFIYLQIRETHDTVSAIF